MAKIQKTAGVLEELDLDELDQEPLSPFMASQLGASPDAAKMQGTPQQLSKKTEVKQTETLATAKRRKKPKDASPEALEQQKYLDDLGGLGFIGDDIRNLVLKDMQAAAEEVDTLDISEEYVQTIPKDQQEAFTTDMTNLAEAINQGDETLLRRLAADIENNYENPALSEAVERDIANSMADRIAEGTLNASEVSLNTLLNAGLATPEELGLNVEQLDEAFGTNWINMTPDQLAMATERLGAREFGEARHLHARLNDPTVSPAMKEDIKDRLADMGATGELTQASQMETLVKQVESSGVIEFGGEVWDLDDLLSDEGMTDVIKGYLDGTPKDKEKFLRNNPQMAAWLDKNQTNLTDALEKLETTEEDLDAIRKEVEAMTIVGETSLDPETMAAFFPEYAKGKFYAEKPEITGGLWEYIQDNKDKESTAQLVRNMNELSKIDPGLAKDLKAIADKNPAKLDQVLRQFVNADPKALESVQIAKGWENLSEDSTTEDFVDYMFGEDATTDTVEAKLRDLKAKAAFDPKAKGMYEALRRTFDTDGDGKIDNPKDLYDNLSGIAPEPISLEDALNGKTAKKGIKEVMDGFDKTYEVDDPLFDTLSGVLTDPNDTVTEDEIEGLFADEAVSESALVDLYTRKDDLPMEAGAKDAIDAMAMEVFGDELDVELETMGISQDVGNQIFNTVPATNQSDKILNQLTGSKADIQDLLTNNIGHFVGQMKVLAQVHAEAKTFIKQAKAGLKDLMKRNPVMADLMRAKIKESLAVIKVIAETTDTMSSKGGAKGKQIVDQSFNGVAAKGTKRNSVPTGKDVAEGLASPILKQGKEAFKIAKKKGWI